MGKRLILTGLGVCVLLIAVVLIAPATMPAQVSVSRSIEIAAPADRAFQCIADYNQFHQWNPWVKVEPDAKITISGDPMSVGHAYTWDGDQIGAGSLEIVELTSPTAVRARLVFSRPFEAQADDRWSIETAPVGCKVTWTYTGQFGYFMRYAAMSLDSALGPQYEQGLKNLKAFAETSGEAH